MITSRHGPGNEGLTICIAMDTPFAELQYTFLSRDEAKRFVLDLMALFAEVTWTTHTHTHALIYGAPQKGVA